MLLSLSFDFIHLTVYKYVLDMFLRKVSAMWNLTVWKCHKSPGPHLNPYGTMPAWEYHRNLASISSGKNLKSYGTKLLTICIQKNRLQGWNSLINASRFDVSTLKHGHLSPNHQWTSDSLKQRLELSKYIPIFYLEFFIDWILINYVQHSINMPSHLYI